MQKKVLLTLAFLFASSFVILFRPLSFLQAQCTPGAAGVNLTDCLLLNDKGETVKDVYSTPTSLINLLVPRVFIVAGIILFFLIIYAGFLFITGEVKGKDKALELGKTAAMGFLIMFCAYWIVQIIKLITGADIPL